MEELITQSEQQLVTVSALYRDWQFDIICDAEQIEYLRPGCGVNFSTLGISTFDMSLIQMLGFDPVEDNNIVNILDINPL